MTPGIYRQYGQQHPVQRVGPNVTDDYESGYLFTSKFH
jgi:chromatin structure-remodeling complex subunit RSC9